MEKVITLLREKNHYLEKFFETNERELLRFDAGNFENIEIFYGTRDRILDLIRVIDDLLSEENEHHERSSASCSASQKYEIESLLKSKDDLVTKILAQDLQVISWIEKEKSNIIRELQSVKKGRRAMQGYRSADPASTLDEKA